MLNEHKKPFCGGLLVGKRVFDLCVVIPTLLLLAPLLLVIAIAVRRDSSGPALFRQTREGYRGVPFSILKFRSMTADVTATGDFKQAHRGDPRITRVGAYLRHSSLDELPQLLNVLGGTMSLVGPRPHVPALSARYAPLIEDYYGRLVAKPGVTGLAQISGCRGETDTLEKMQARIRWDRAYVARHSLIGDIAICWHTLKCSLGSDDAY